MDALENRYIPFLLKTFIEDCFPVEFSASGGLLLSNHFSVKWEHNCKQSLHIQRAWTSLILSILSDLLSKNLEVSVVFLPIGFDMSLEFAAE